MSLYDNVTVDQYRSIMQVLKVSISNVYDLMEATDAIAAMWPATTPKIKSPNGMATWDGYSWSYNPDHLVNVAKADANIAAWISEGKKIQAIKELRTLTQCTLKEAKQAIEDPRVSGFMFDPKFTDDQLNEM